MRQTRTGNLVVTQAETAGAPHLNNLLDVVYVVRDDDASNESLRYSLRSLINLPHRNVYISGGKPSWIKNCYHVAKDIGDMEIPEQEDSNLNLYLATTVPTLSDDFIFMNDDFFIMKPTESIEVMHQGSLDDRIAQYKSDHRFHQAYSLIKTREVLLRYGCQNLLSYELHMPMIFNKRKLWALFQDWEEPLFALRPRTMYGNLYKINGVNTLDAKNSTNPEERFISTGADFDISIAGELVHAKFTRPSSYEQESDTTRNISSNGARRNSVRTH